VEAHDAPCNGAPLHGAPAGVAQVELLADTPSQPGVWFPAPPCAGEPGFAQDAGGSAWCPLFKPSGEGEYNLMTRATDWAGNQETSRVTRLYVDATPPNVTLAQTNTQVLAAQRHPTLKNTWQVHLNGTVSDPALTGGRIAGSGVQTDSVRVALLDSIGEIPGGRAQTVVLSGTTWSLDYIIKVAQPTGRYTVRVTALDRVGNSTQFDRGPFQIDAVAPGGDVNAASLSSIAISSTQTLQGVASEAPAPRDTALLLHLEENSGATRFYDNSGAFRHAECAASNCPTAAAIGQYGRAAQFNGTSNYLQIAHSSINERAAGLSVAAWIKPGTSSGTQRLVSTAQTRSANGFSFGLRNGTLLFSALGVKDYATGAVDLSNRRMHVAAVLDAGALRLYQDGHLQSVFTSTAALGTAALLADTDDVLLIGAGMNAGSATPVDLYNGLLDQVIVVGRALSADEVRVLAQPQTAGLAGMQIAFRSTLPGSPFYNEPPLAGETLHLTLDDTPDQNGALTWKDVSGQGHNGTCSGASCPAYGTSGHTGSAALFDGQQNSIALSNWGTFTTTTVSAWVKRTGATRARETIVSYKEAGSCGLVLSLNEDKANHYPRIYVRVGGAWRYAEQAVAIPLNTWVHLAATYDGATIRLYRDGQPVASTAAAGSMSQCNAVSAVGSRSDGVSHRFPGVIDEVRMLDRALATDVLREQLYLGSDPMLALPFDEAWALDGSRLPDASGWAHDGTLHTGTDNTNKAVPGAVGAPPPVGRFGLQLDGVDDYVSIDQQAGLLPGSRFSLAAWVYPSPADSNAYPIISSDAYTNLLYASPYLQVVNRTGLQTSFSNGTQAPPLSVSGVLTENTWNHVAATFDGTTYRLYVNGAERLASAAFAGRRPVGINRLDVGRGLPGTSACVVFSRLTLTPRSMGFYKVALNGTTLYQSASQTTPNTVINISTADPVCAQSTLQVTYTGPSPALNWQRSITLHPQPGQGSQTLSHPTYNYTADVAWTLAAQSASLRYWRGGLDDVRVYARALLPLEVQALYLSGWQTAALPLYTTTQSVSGVNLSGWSAAVPSGLEGSFALDLRGIDMAGHVGVADRAAQAWNSQVDTLAPRVSVTRTTVGNQYHFQTVAEDFNLSRYGFSSACGAGVISTTETYRSPWYQAAVGQSSLADKVYRLTAECNAAQSGLFETGVWADRTVSSRIAVSGTHAYVPAGALWRVDLSKPNLPNSPASYNPSGDGRGVALSGSRAYIADGSQFLTIVDLSNPGAAPVKLNPQGIGIANSIVVSGSYAYLAVGNGAGNGVSVIDISNPSNPVVAGGYSPSVADTVAIALHTSPSGDL